MELATSSICPFLATTRQRLLNAAHLKMIVEQDEGVFSTRCVRCLSGGCKNTGAQDQNDDFVFGFQVLLELFQTVFVTFLSPGRCPKVTDKYFSQKSQKHQRENKIPSSIEERHTITFVS